ncbi:MAG: hypothetical protein H7Y88_07220 [Phycisphaerales bacterium]|nr:hypothetical protein [Phycisphaerales bacterium]
MARTAPFPHGGKARPAASFMRTTRHKRSSLFLKDATGLEVSVLPALARIKFEKGAAPAYRETLHACRSAAASQGRSLRRVLAAFIFIASIVLSAVYYTWYTWFDLMISGLLFVVPGLLVGLAVLGSDLGIRRRRLAQLRLAHGLCAACMARLTPAPEGGAIVRCPKCLAAWQVQSTPSAAPSDPRSPA